MPFNLENAVKQSKNGDRQALEMVIFHIQTKIYGLALRMLGDPQDAEDEAQEILIKVITHLSDFREESAFNTWVYRIACNHLLTKRYRKSERMGITFEFLDELISRSTENMHPLTVSGPERAVLLEEARLSCMQAVLACLEKEMRIVFILGESYGVTSKEGAFILNITPDTFRKRLSRSRKRMRTFMQKNCGLVNANNACRCHQQVQQELKSSLASPVKKFQVKNDEAGKGRATALAQLKELSEINRTTAMFRRYPEYQLPDSFATIVKDLINSGKYRVFSE